MTIRSVAASVAVAVAVSVAAADIALAASALGKVDTKRVFDEWKEAQTSQSDFKRKTESLRRKAEEYQREFNEKNQELQEASRKGKTKEEIAELTKKYENELKPKKEAIDAMQQQAASLDRELSGRLRKKIETAIQAVAKAKGIPVVVDKQIVLAGGEDITDDVLKRLNK